MSIELDDIKSNNQLVCIQCGDLITLDNYSGWEAFTSDGKTTQPICKFCDEINSFGGEKSKDAAQAQAF